MSKTEVYSVIVMYGVYCKLKEHVRTESPQHRSKLLRFCLPDWTQNVRKVYDGSISVMELFWDCWDVLLSLCVGKNGIDAGPAKNAVGTFAHPLAVLVHLPFFRTLSPRHFANGMAEVIKIGASPERGSSLKAR